MPEILRCFDVSMLFDQSMVYVVYFGRIEILGIRLSREYGLQHEEKDTTTAWAAPVIYCDIDLEYASVAMLDVFNDSFR